MTIDEIKRLKESEHKVEFKEAQFCYPIVTLSNESALLFNRVPEESR